MIDDPAPSAQIDEAERARLVALGYAAGRKDSETLMAAIVAEMGADLRPAPEPVRVYFDFADWWVGYYRGPNNHYLCLLPTLVIRWPRRRA